MLCSVCLFTARACSCQGHYSSTLLICYLLTVNINQIVNLFCHWSAIRRETSLCSNTWAEYFYINVCSIFKWCTFQDGRQERHIRCTKTDLWLTERLTSLDQAVTTFRDGTSWKFVWTQILFTLCWAYRHRNGLPLCHLLFKSTTFSVNVLLQLSQSIPGNSNVTYYLICVHWQCQISMLLCQLWKFSATFTSSDKTLYLSCK